jgi:hypothetical protein
MLGRDELEEPFRAHSGKAPEQPLEMVFAHADMRRDRGQRRLFQPVFVEIADGVLDPPVIGNPVVHVRCRPSVHPFAACRHPRLAGHPILAIAQAGPRQRLSARRGVAMPAATLLPQ